MKKGKELFQTAEKEEEKEGKDLDEEGVNVDENVEGEGEDT